MRAEQNKRWVVLAEFAKVGKRQTQSAVSCWPAVLQKKWLISATGEGSKEERHASCCSLPTVFFGC